MRLIWTPVPVHLQEPQHEAPFDQIRADVEAIVSRIGPAVPSFVTSGKEAQAFNVLLEHAKALVDPADDSPWPKIFHVDRTQMVDSTPATVQDLKAAARKVLELLPGEGGASAQG